MVYKNMIKEFYNEQGYDTDLCNNFYYDETNNFRKFKFKETGLNIDNFLQKYRLGGITLDKNRDVSEIYKELYSSLNIQGELKFKQINSGKTNTFINCLNGKNLKKILEFLNNNTIYIHSYSFDNLYDVIIEIVDSLLEQYLDIYYYLASIMKNDLYFFVLTDIERFIDILEFCNYPNITDKNIELFCKNMTEWLEESDTSMIFGLENCRQLFKVYLKNGELLFLKNNKEKVIIDGYSGINFDMCIKFDKSFHYFDEIPELEQELNKYEVDNYKFVDSKMNVQIQLSDVIIGLLNRFFEFLDQNTYEKIIKKLKNISDFQKDNLVLFLEIYKQSVEKNEMFFCFYEPMKLVMERNNKILNLIKLYKI